MTALGSPVTPAVDAARMRRTYRSVLGDPWIGLPPMGGEEQRAHVAGLLRGQLRVLLPGVEAKVGGMRGETQRTAEYVIGRVRGALAVSFAQAREPEQLLDLAQLSRALLALYEQRRPAAV